MIIRARNWNFIDRSQQEPESDFIDARYAYVAIQEIELDTNGAVGVASVETIDHELVHCTRESLELKYLS